MTTYSISPTSERLVSLVKNGATYTYGYTGVGQVNTDGTNAFAYGDDGRLESVASASTGALDASYQYNGLGQRVWKQVPGPAGNTNTAYVYDESGHLIEEFNGRGTLLATHVWLGDRPLAYFPAGGLSTPIKFIHTDNLGTPRVMTNGNPAVIWLWQSDPFGNGAATAISNGGSFYLRQPGQFDDTEDGYYYNYFRDYAPGTGRYIESDPIGLKGGINTYTYAMDNPTWLVDPFGLCSQSNDKPENPEDIPGTPQYVKHCINQYLSGNYGNYLGNYVIQDNSLIQSAADIGGGVAETGIIKKIGNILSRNGYKNVGEFVSAAGEIAKKGSEPSDIVNGSLAVMSTIAQSLANIRCTGSIW